MKLSGGYSVSPFMRGIRGVQQLAVHLENGQRVYFTPESAAGNEFKRNYFNSFLQTLFK
jgi:hypothetical protein